MFKKKKPIKPYIVIFIFFILACFLVKISSDKNFKNNFLRSAFLSIENIFVTPLKKNVDINFNTAEIESLKTENSELKSLLNIQNNYPNFTLVNANVLNRNLDGWFNNLTIDVGSKDNIKKGDAVITSFGLVGKISQVLASYSEVTLLTFEPFKKIAVQIQAEKPIEGILEEYDQAKNVFYVRGIGENTPISKDTLVTTSPIGSIFPPGLLIGKVSLVTTDQYDFTKTLVVTPSANLQKVNFVAVLRSDSDD